ncbi:amidohydrolase family protein [candidate division KSB1 bacterium]|nr:amidohydrolase family protein [candidate division KSB1 bacterium]
MEHKMTRRTFVKTTGLASLGLLTFCSARNRFDIIIRNGTVFDGISPAGRKLDIGISGERIAAMDNLENASADVIIDAAGLAVAPGFVDIHTHTDTELFVNPLAESKIRQGVTTEVGGNCGSSPFPLNDADFAEMEKNLQEKYELPLTWRNIQQFLDELEKTKISLNYATLTGHGDLRSFVIGKNDVQPSADQLDQMKRRLAETMEQGSFGLSTGLEYAPSSYAKTPELIELCKVVSNYEGLYATHMRSEDEKVREAVEEALQICEQASVPLQISHLKACNKANWHKTEKLLEMIDQALNSGLPVNADRYPYIAYGTGLGTFLPLWARQGTNEEITERLKDRTLIGDIREYAASRAQRIGGWDRVLISNCGSEEGMKYEGKYILECAEQEQADPVDFALNLLKEENMKVGIIGFAMDEDNLKNVLSSPPVMVGSDGCAVAPYGKLAEGKPHPRFYGTFPRVLGKYCREENIFDLGTAIRKMTSMPAEKMGLKKRGMLKKDYFADITIFNSQAVIDRATFINPHQYAEGIEYVIVNGKITIERGEHTGEFAGSVLRHQAV